MKKRKLKRKGKILLTIGVFIVSILVYLFLGFLGAYKDVKVVGSIFVFFGWIWLCMGHLVALYGLWRS